MRILTFLLLFSLGSVIVNGQVAPKPVPSTSPPPPPPPPTPSVGAGNPGNAGTGFRLLKIPVTGNYYLGMTRKEYDSLKGTDPLTLKTPQSEYMVTAAPLFSGMRLFMLSLSIDSSFSSSPPADILEMYETKLGEPDKKEAVDTTWQLPDANDPSLKVEYAVKKTSLRWSFLYHHISLTVLLIDLRNGRWRSVHTIRYTGNESFRSMLQDLEDRERY